MKVTANGKSFEFPDGTSTEEIGTAVDEYFAGQATQQVGAQSPANSQQTPQNGGSLTQAARGLANIPFDLLQGGANLINAGSRAIGAGDVLDPIYRPVDRPTDQYAQAGEAIGGYMLPVGAAAKAAGATGKLASDIGLAGNIATGSLAEASNQQGDFVENAAKNAAINLGAQGLLSGAAKLVGRGVTALKGDIAPEVAQRIANAESMGITPMTSDIAAPVKDMGAFAKGLVQGGEGAILGTGTRRAEQQAARSKAVGSYLDSFGDYNADDIVKSLTGTLKARQKSAGAVLDDVTVKMGSTPVKTTNAVNAIDLNIAKIERLGKTGDQSLLNNLRNLKEELVKPDINFDLLKQHRTQFRNNVKGDAMVFPKGAEAATNAVESALTRDLRGSVTQALGSGEAARYIKANSDYASIFNKALNKKIATNLNNATSQSTPELINNSLFSKNASDIKRIWGSLDEKGKDAMRAAYIGRISDSVGGNSPAKFMTQINKMKKQAGGEIYNTVFSGRHMKELNALSDVLETTSRADAASVVSQTGQALANPMRIGAGMATLGKSLAGEAGYGLMMRVYESKPIRNALLRLANTKSGTPSYERALNQAAILVRPLVANQATNEE